MLLSLKWQVSDGYLLRFQGMKHLLSLVRWHDLVFEPLEKDDRAGDLVYKVDGRTLNVEVALLRIWTYETKKVARLVLVRLSDKYIEVTDAKMTDTGSEEVPEGNGAEGGITARARTANSDPAWIRQPALNQVFRAI